MRISLPPKPVLRQRTVMDNLTGHHTGDFVRWLFAHGIIPLSSSLGGRWLTMAESIQRILKRRPLEGQYPQATEDVIAWLEAVARGWNRAPTPFAWGGKRQERRQQARRGQHHVGGACTLQPFPRSS